MTGTFLVVEQQMRKSILDEFLKLGTAISNNLSAVNANYVTTYNYVGIEQSVSNAASNNGLAYALIQYFDGDVASYSGWKNIREDVVRKKGLTTTPSRIMIRSSITFILKIQASKSARSPHPSLSEIHSGQRFASACR